MDLAPGVTRGLIKAVEGGVEVVDLRDAFSRHPRTKPTVLIPRDHHWSLEGRKVAAAELGRRLQRYAFVRAKAADKKLFGWGKAKGKWTKFVPIITYDGPDQATWRLAAALGWGAGFAGRNGSGDQNQAPMYTPIMCIGDSQVGMQGDGFIGIYQCISMQVGMVVGFVGGRNAGASRSLGEYLRALPVIPSEPRVIILVNTGLGCNSIQRLLEQRAVVRKVGDSGEIEHIRGTKVRVVQPTALPADLTKRSYKDAYRTIVAEVLTGLLRGKKIQLVQEIMKNHKLLPGPKLRRSEKSQRIKKGNILSVTLNSWEATKKKRPELTGVMLLDDSDLLDCPRYALANATHSYDRSTSLTGLPQAIADGGKTAAQ